MQKLKFFFKNKYILFTLDKYIIRIQCMDIVKYQTPQMCGGRYIYNTLCNGQSSVISSVDGGQILGLRKACSNEVYFLSTLIKLCRRQK